MNRKAIYTTILAVILSGCKSENASSPMVQSEIIPEVKPLPQTPEVEVIPDVEEEVIPEPEDTPEPPKPTTPIFAPEGISTITQHPYSGTVIRGGDAYLRYDSGVTDFQDFELPKWSVTYRYQPYLEVLITDGTETLCARYSWKLKGFGYAKAQCLWSDARAAVPLSDIKSAYYGYSVVESRVLVNGVVGLGVEAK